MKVTNQDYAWPNTGTRVPVVSEFCSEAKKPMVSAISAGFGHLVWSAFGIDLRLAGVSIVDGSTALIRIPSARSSGASDCVSAATPAFDVTYEIMPGAGVMAGRAATLTMRPPVPERRIALTATRHARKQVTVFMRHCFSKSARDVSASLA